MTTITITLEDELAARLREQAESLGVAPEELARRGVENVVEQTKSKFAPDFEQAISKVLEENAELYRRLA
jgi:predicted transcriptional regulator